MSDDWQVGDLALCVQGEVGCEPPLRAGMIFTVAEVGTGYGPQGDLALGLAFVGLPQIHFGGDIYNAHDGWRFRKIRPHAPDAEDRETIELMNGKPVPMEA